MARKTNMRGRPGLIFISIIVVCLIIFYLSWKSMMAPKPKPDFSAIDRRQDHLKLGKLDRKNWREEPSYQVFKNYISTVPKQTKEEVVKDQAAKPWTMSEQQIRDDEEKTRQEMEMMLENKKKLFENAASDQKKKADKPWFIEPDPSVVKTVTNMEKLVHLDLKGAAPKVSYLRELFPLLSKLGATGLLIEYEDTFPYTGELKELAANNAYSMDEIKTILQLAKENRLMVMPLIQTFGHMEFVLKYEDKILLRETDYTPQVIDSSSEVSYKLISAIIDQIMQAHQGIRYLHIGCDEVYELGRGKSLTVMSSQKASTHDLFLKHVLRVAGLVKKYGITPIMWDDELRSMDAKDLENSGFPGPLEVMIWNYELNVSRRVPIKTWEMYSSIFNNVWIASAFKGSKNPYDFYTEPGHQLMNHISWLSMIKQLSSLDVSQKGLQISGIALTGWQRFDHFSVLCELFPVAIPSLAVCLAAINNGGFTEDIYKSASNHLRCSNMIEMEMPIIDSKTKKAIVTQDCRFPGHEIFYLMQEFYGLTKIQDELLSRQKGWLSSYQMRNGFTNNGIMKVMDKKLNKLNLNLEQSKLKLKLELLKVYSNDTVDEWIQENIDERLQENRQMAQKVSDLIKLNVWNKRPLPSLQEAHISKAKQSPGQEELDSNFSKLKSLGNLATMEIRNRLEKQGIRIGEPASKLDFGKKTHEETAAKWEALAHMDSKNQGSEPKLPAINSETQLSSLSRGDQQQMKEGQESQSVMKVRSNFGVGKGDHFHSQGLSGNTMSPMFHESSDHKNLDRHPLLPKLDHYQRNANKENILESDHQNIQDRKLPSDDAGNIQRRLRPDDHQTVDKETLIHPVLKSPHILTPMSDDHPLRGNLPSHKIGKLSRMQMLDRLASEHKPSVEEVKHPTDKENKEPMKNPSHLEPNNLEEEEEFRRQKYEEGEQDSHNEMDTLQKLKVFEKPVASNSKRVQMNNDDMSREKFMKDFLESRESRYNPTNQ